MKFARQLVLAMTAFAVAGCAGQPGRDAVSLADDVDAEIWRAIQQLEVRADHAESAAPPLARETRPPQADEHRFDVNSEGTPAEWFFLALVDETDENIIVHPDIRGNISLKLNDVTVEEVLDVVSQVYGYTYRRNSAGYMIFPRTLQTRIFQVDYLDLQRSGVSRTRVSSGQVSENRGRNNRFAGALAAGAMALPGGNLDNQQEISGSNIDTRYETDFWTDLEETLVAMLGSAEGGRVVVNSQTGVIVVQAMPDKLRDIESYLAMIQDVAGRQVVLEAKILEVQLNDSFRAGINWIAVAQNSSGDTSTLGQLAPPSGFPGSDATLGGQPLTVSPGNALTELTGETLGGAFTMAFDVGDFNAFIELLELQGETRVLSSPRVSTLNNQKAVIKAGTDEFFVTNVASNTVTGASSTTSRDVELTPFFSGIALDVTPQISGSGEVTLHIHPTVSEVVDQQKNLTVSGETDILPLAFSEVRESDSIVKAKSGQIIVIGGLMRQTRVDENFGAPGLSRLPGIGGLFKSRRSEARKTELVILLKPIVVEDDADWGTVAHESYSRLGGRSR